MKTRIVAWSLGLLGVCSLAGCGWERPFRSPLLPCKGCFANGRSSASNRKAAQAQTIETADIEGPDTTAPFPVSNKQMPILEEDIHRPAENALVPIPIPGKDRENALVPIPIPGKDRDKALPTSSYKEIEHLLPMAKGQEKIVVLSVDDAKPAGRPFVAPEKIKAAEVADAELVNALNRLGANKALRGDDKILPLQSTHILYGQVDNYQELTGQLQQWRKTWRLRYAAVGAEETYGGSVMLEGIADTSKLRDGQHLRVRGRLIPPENRQDSPRYVVQSIDVLD